MAASATTRSTPRPAAAEAALLPGQASKTLMVLGLLQSGPKHGYELHRIVVAHGSLYADFKKPTLYHLLHRLALQGAVKVTSQGGARGPRGERLVFALAAEGRALFLRLLRAALGSYDGSPAGFEVAVAFLASVPPAQARDLLRRRRDTLRARRAEVIGERDHMTDQPGGSRLTARLLATDHAICLLEAEIAWADRALRQLAQGRRSTEPAPALRRAVGA